MHLRAKYLLITTGLFTAEVLIATIFSHIVFVRSYLGDYLVVILIYYLVKSIRDVSAPILCVGVFLFACGVEILQYFHTADLLGLARGSLLSILIGNRFSWMDILMYLAGCLTCYFSSRLALLKPGLHSGR